MSEAEVPKSLRASLNQLNLHKVSLISRGWQGTVYSAWGRALNRRVAIKILNAGRTANDERRVVREAMVLGALRGHRGIVELFDHGRLPLDGRPYLVMELGGRGSLQSIKDRTGPFGWDVAAEIGAALASALAFTHDRGIVHGDVKPANVVVDCSGRVLLVDFGIARMEGVVDVPGQVHGSPRFMDPTFRPGLDTPSPASDVYSLAATVVAVAAAEGRFVYDYGYDSVDPPTSPRVGPPREAIQSILLAALQSRACERPSATEVAHALGPPGADRSAQRSMTPPASDGCSSGLVAQAELAEQTRR